MSDDELGLDTPRIARIYDWQLGGSAHTAVDRAAAAELYRVFPGSLTWAQHNRAFLNRAVRTLAGVYGIDQFLDLGCGAPTVGNVYEIAQQENPHARVDYVDCDPLVATHMRRAVADEPYVTLTQADLRDPEAVLAAPGVAGLLDFTRPVAVLALAVLDIIAADPSALIASYRAACCSGSALAFTHQAQLASSESEITGYLSVLSHTDTPAGTFRTPTQIAGLLEGYQLIEPGLVPSAQWRPATPVSDEDARESHGYAAVGLLPGGEGVVRGGLG